MTNGFTSPWLQESPKEVDDCTDGWIQGLVTGSGGCPGRSAFPEGATQKMFVSGMEQKRSPITVPWFV